MLGLIKGTFLGLLVTVLLYLIPGINLIAPLLGGLAGGMTARQGLAGGVAVGFLMTAVMLLPGLALAYAVNNFLGSIDLFSAFQWIGEVAAGHVLLIWAVLISHTAILGFIGAVIGGAAAGRET